jgi:cell division protein FtsB
MTYGPLNRSTPTSCGASAARATASTTTGTANDSFASDETLPKLPPRRPEQVWLGRALCFAGCVLAANALIGERGLSETLRAREAFRAGVADLSRLQYENAQLAEEIRRLRQDSGTIESLARQELGLIKPGEVLVVIKTSTQK